MKYKDPVYGEVELELIDQQESSLEEGKKLERIYRYPSGDYVIFSTIIQPPFEPFEQTFYIKSSWVKSIISRENGK